MHRLNGQTCIVLSTPKFHFNFNSLSSYMPLYTAIIKRGDHKCTHTLKHTRMYVCKCRVRIAWAFANGLCRITIVVLLLYCEESSNQNFAVDVVVVVYENIIWGWGGINKNYCNYASVLNAGVCIIRLFTCLFASLFSLSLSICLFSQTGFQLCAFRICLFCFWVSLLLCFFRLIFA